MAQEHASGMMIRDVLTTQVTSQPRASKPGSILQHDIEKDLSKLTSKLS
jgi:hypothetical protein